MAVSRRSIRGRFTRRAGLAALALLAPASASAAPDWTSPVNYPVASQAFGGQAEIRYQRGGLANEAFLEVQSQSPLQTTLHIGVQPVLGGYIDQLTIPSVTGAIPLGAQIAVAANGAAVAAWSELTGSNPETSPLRYRAAYRAANTSSWETPVTIATDSERNKAIYAYLTPTIGADGTAAIAVQHIASGEKGSGRNELLYRIDVAVYRPGNGWLEPTRLTPVSISGEYTALTLDGHGDITAAYAKRFSEGASSESTDDRTTVVVRRLSAGSTLWGPEEDVTGSNITHSAFALHLGEDEAGDAVLAYQYGDYVAKEFAVWGVTRQGANGSWTSSTQLVTGASAPVDAGVAPNGKAYVLYSFQGNSSNEDCEGVLRGATGGSFTVPRCVSPANEDTFNGSLAFLGNDAYFAWRGNVPGESSNATVQAARWPDSSSLPEIARNLDSPGASYGQPTLVNDNEGSIVAFYTNKTNELRVAAYDAGPPIPWNGRVPTIVEVGRPLNVSGTYVDLWSALAGPTTWEFGDGTPAVAGNAVSHVFTAAGSYPVTATAADKLGNTTSHTYNITVYAPGDTAAPSVTLEAPRCRKRMSKKACKQWLASRRAWQTLTGTVVDPAPSSGIANVQVAVYRSSGRRVEGLSGKRFRKTTKAKARKTFSSARLSGGRWSLKLPKLKAGLYTILVRASDRVGYISPTVSKAIRLR